MVLDPTTGDAAVAERPNGSADPAQVRRLRRFLDWMVPIVFVFAPLDLAIGLFFDAPRSAILGALLFGLGGLLLYARRALRRGRLEQAVLLTALTISLCTPVFVVLRPALFPVLAMGSLLAVSVALPFLRGARLKQLIVTAWCISVVVIVLGDALSAHAPSELPPVVTRVSVGASLAILMGLVLLMMGQFSARLNDTLARAQSAQRAVEASNSELQRLHRVKTDFMNQAAHELNTPLTPIRLQLHLLRSEDLPPERNRQAIAIVDRNVERLTALVRDLLDASRLEAGRLVLQIRPVEARRLLEDVVETFDEPARRARLTLTSHAAEGILIHADAKRVTQVLYNLVLNAIKFTPPGGEIRVAASLEQGRARFSVSDTGTGIKAEDIGRLFQPFSQVGAPPGAAPSGTGLGLYISRGIVEAHGGRIWVESAGPDRGSTFSFELPNAAQGTAAPAPTVVPSLRAVI